MILFLIILTLAIFCLIVYKICMRDDTIEDSSSYSARPMTYEDLLHTKEWYDFRNRILYLKGHQCEWCGNPSQLQVHHRFYKRHYYGGMFLPWEYGVSDVNVLCDSCHYKAHQKYKINTYTV